MKMKGMFAIAAGVASLLSGVTMADAEELKFSYVENGGYEFSFLQSSNPVPASAATGTFTIVTVSDLIANFTPGDDMVWYHVNGDPGDFDFVFGPMGLIGPQVYSGTEWAPVFAPGTYAGFDPTDGLQGVLTVSAAAVPEPATWAMLILGVALIGFAVRQRRKGAMLAA